MIDNSQSIVELINRRFDDLRDDFKTMNAQLNEHKGEDQRRFNRVDKLIWTASGFVAAIVLAAKAGEHFLK